MARVPLLDLVSNADNHIVLLGHPGAGKTTSLSASRGP